MNAMRFVRNHVIDDLTRQLTADRKELRKVRDELGTARLQLTHERHDIDVIRGEHRAEAERLRREIRALGNASEYWRQLQVADAGRIVALTEERDRLLGHLEAAFRLLEETRDTLLSIQLGGRGGDKVNDLLGRIIEVDHS